MNLMKMPNKANFRLMKNEVISRFDFSLFTKYREITIAFDSKRGLCAVGRRKLTRGDTDLDMCADSTLYEYIPRILVRSQIVIAA